MYALAFQIILSKTAAQESDKLGVLPHTYDWQIVYSMSSFSWPGLDQPWRCLGLGPAEMESQVYHQFLHSSPEFSAAGLSDTWSVLVSSLDVTCQICLVNCINHM